MIRKCLRFKININKKFRVTNKKKKNEKKKKTLTKWTVKYATNITYLFELNCLKNNNKSKIFLLKTRKT